MLDRAAAKDKGFVGDGDTSILNIWAPHLQNVPRLIWLFPEGDPLKAEELFKVKVNLPK